MSKRQNKKTKKRFDYRAFSLVELLIAMVVIAVLTAISVVAYNGVQRRAAAAEVVNQIDIITEAILLEEVKTRMIPEDINHLYTPDPSSTLIFQNATIPGGLPYYGVLTPPENGKLFYDICVELVAQGLGRGNNDYGDNQIDYISSCNVFNTNYLQINGWNGGFKVSDPSVTEHLLQGYVQSAAEKNDNHPSYIQTLQNFMNVLIDRFKKQGGTFPITSFWQPWVGEPTLPAPTSVTKPEYNFCLIMTSNKFPDVSYVTSKENPNPRPGVACDIVMP